MAVHQEKRKALEPPATLLVVEDEPALVTMMRIVLQRAGLRVLTATDGEEAVRVWTKEEGNIDLLLADMMIPRGLSGTALATRLRESRPDLKMIFIAVIMRSWRDRT